MCYLLVKRQKKNLFLLDWMYCKGHYLAEASRSHCAASTVHKLFFLFPLSILFTCFHCLLTQTVHAQCHLLKFKERWHVVGARGTNLFISSFANLSVFARATISLFQQQSCLWNALFCARGQRRMAELVQDESKTTVTSHYKGGMLTTHVQETTKLLQLKNTLDAISVGYNQVNAAVVQSLAFLSNRLLEKHCLVNEVLISTAALR